METRLHILVFFAIMLSLLTGCNASAPAKAKTLAEEYAQNLSKTVNDDTIIFTEDAVSQSGKELFTFTMWTDKYQQNFSINVNGNTVTDTYFAAALQDSVKEEWQKLLDSMPGYKLTGDASINTNIVSSSLSGKVYDSIYDVYKDCSMPSLVTATLTFTEEEYRNQERIYNTLTNIRNQGFYCEVTVTGDFSRYEVSEDGLYYLIESGSDGGAYIDKIPFSPDVES